jgi:hypothetical protein
MTTRTRHSLAIVTALLAALGATAALAQSRGFELVDARRGVERADVRNVAGGAEVVFADRAFGRSLAEQLADRLQRAQGFDGNVRRLTVTEARLTMFIEDAFATPALASIDPGIRRLGEMHMRDQLYQYRVQSRLAERRITVMLAGDADGRPFESRKQIVFRDPAQETRSRQRVVNLALDDAVAQILGRSD